MIVATLLATIASFALLTAVFGPLERAFPARAGQKVVRRDSVVDACFFLGQYFAWNSVAIFAIDLVRPFIAMPIAPVLPIWLQVVLAVGLGDFVVYWFHRASHAFEPLWRFHAVHHSATELDWLAAHREHPVDGILTQLCMNAPAIILGVPPEALAGVVAFRAIWAVFIHSNVRLPLGPLASIFGSPELHHWHHAKVERTVHNFANLGPWLESACSEPTIGRRAPRRIRLASTNLGRAATRHSSSTHSRSSRRFGRDTQLRPRAMLGRSCARSTMTPCWPLPPRPPGPRRRDFRLRTPDRRRRAALAHRPRGARNQQFAPRMRRGGSIVLNTSITYLRGPPFTSAVAFPRRLREITGNRNSTLTGCRRDRPAPPSTIGPRAGARWHGPGAANGNRRESHETCDGAEDAMGRECLDSRPPTFHVGLRRPSSTRW